MDGRLRAALAVAVVLLVGLAAGPPAVADGHFDIAVPDALDLPPRTVTVQDQTFTVDGTLRTDPGVSHAVEVTAPDEVYRVYVYNSDGQVEEQQRGDGPETFTFDFAGYANGSYALAISHDGDIEDVFPVVVSGYDVSHDAPGTAEPGDPVEVTVDVTPTLADGPPAAVTVVLADEATSVRETAELQSDGRYAATVSTADLDAGTYTVWAVAQGDEQAFGHQEVLGMSTPAAVELTDATPTDGGSGGSGSGGSSPTATVTMTNATPPTPSSPTGQPTSATDDGPVTTQTTAGGTDESPSGPTDDVITPAPTVVTPATGVPTPVAGNADGAVVVALLLAATVGGLLWRRR